MPGDCKDKGEIIMKFGCLATAISSMPHDNVKKACRLVLDLMPEVPVWPQLPNLNFRENMYAQYSENMPCLVIDENRKKVYFKTDGDVTSELEKFYEKIIADDVGYFKISQDHASGLYGLIEEIKSSGKPAGMKWIKGQVTGPVTFGLTVTDQNNKSILYDEQLGDTVVKTCAMKSRWQVRMLSESTGTSNVIMFIDEPYLSSFGSSFVSISREDIIKHLNEVITAIHSEKAIAGIHCCGNTDWSILMETDIDIISFDAYNYIESMTLYPEKLKEYFDNGKCLAWGIVPSSENIEKETRENLIKRFNNGVDMLVNKGLSREQLWNQCLITPSCGTGSMAVELAEKVFKLNKEVSDGLRRNTNG